MLSLKVNFLEELFMMHMENKTFYTSNVVHSDPDWEKSLKKFILVFCSLRLGKSMSY